MIEKRSCEPTYPGWEADSNGNIYYKGTLITGRLHQGRVSVTINGKTVRRSWLVCTAFHGPRPVGLECMHEDDNKLNDVPDNLSWGTRAQNLSDAFKNSCHVRHGEFNGNSVLTKQDVDNIRREYATGKVPQTQLAKVYGVGQRTISKIVNHKLWVEA